MGYLVLIPLGLLAWLCGKAINYSVGGGDERRVVGILTCLLLGGAMIGIGYWTAFVGWEDAVWEGGSLVTYKYTVPIAGWIGLLSGGFFTIVGPIWSTVGKKKFDEDT